MTPSKRKPANGGLLGRRGKSYFGWRLARLASVAAGAESDFRSRHAELVAALIHPAAEPSLTVELRLVSRPEPDTPSSGEVKVGLLCRLDHPPGAPVTAAAEGVAVLLQGTFEEYDFARLEASDLRWFLEPFEAEHFVSVGRRTAWARLDTLRSATVPRRKVGFGADAEATGSSGSHAAEIFHVYPFAPTWAPFDRLLQFLLMERSPVAISFRMRPTCILEGEEALLERQIATCERHAQASLGVIPEDLASLRPTLREQAQHYRQLQERRIYGLRQSAASLSVEIASPQKVSGVIAHAVGGLLTFPTAEADRGSGGLSGYLCGGYDVRGSADVRRARRGFQTLELQVEPRPDSPAGGERLAGLFTAGELAAAFRLPPPTPHSPPGLESRRWRRKPPPRELPSEGVLLGEGVEHALRPRTVRISPDDRLRHVYCVGQTGTGKTTILRTMVLEDIEAGSGVCVIDPHGDLFTEILAKIPEHRAEDVVLLDPTDTEWPVGLNLLEAASEAQRHYQVQELTGIVRRLLEDELGAGAAQQFAGPIFFQHIRMSLLLASSNRDDPGTLLEVYNIFLQPEYWRRWLPLRTSDPLLERWVNEVLPKTDYLRQGSEGTSLGAYVGSKLESYVFDPMLRNIFGQKRSTLDLADLMNQGKILLVNLAKGLLTEANSRFLGMLLLAKLQAAVMGRARIPKRQRRAFYVYVDEFQSIATEGFVGLLSEGRKFGLGLVLANQFITQVRDQRIMEAVLGNTGTVICFRLGQRDAERLEQEVAPAFSRVDLLNLPNWHAYISLLAHGQALPPFLMRTVPDARVPDGARADRIRGLSRRAFARSRAEVEKEIESSLAAPEASR